MQMCLPFVLTVENYRGCGCVFPIGVNAMYKINVIHRISGTDFLITKSTLLDYYNVLAVFGARATWVFHGTLAECRNYLKDYQNRCKGE